MIIDHLGIVISDYTRSKNFYTQCLAPLGIELIAEDEGWSGFGSAGKPDFWFGQDGAAHARIFPAGPHKGASGKDRLKGIHRDCTRIIFSGSGGRRAANFSGFRKAVQGGGSVFLRPSPGNAPCGAPASSWSCRVSARPARSR